MTKHCQMNTKGADDFLNEFPVRYEYNTFFVVFDADVCLFFLIEMNQKYFILYKITLHSKKTK